MGKCGFNSLNSTETSSTKCYGKKTKYDDYGNIVHREKVEDKTMSPTYQKVLRKLIAAHTFDELRINEQEAKEDIVKSLSNREMFKKKFFDNENKIDQELEKLEEGLLTTSVESVCNENIKDELEHLTKDLGEFDVRFFLTKTDASEIMIIKNIANSSLKYGAFHAGIEIEGVRLEWGKGIGGESIVYPNVDEEEMLLFARLHVNIPKIRDKRSMKTFDMIACYKAESSDIEEFKNNALDQICQVCVDYNTKYHYNASSRNCQKFVDHVLKAINCKFEPEGEFKVFLDRIKKEHNSNFEFRFKERIFKCRSDLDQYASQCWDYLESTWDRKLLVCFHDLMENQYKIKDSKESRWGPIEKENEIKWHKRIQSLQ